MRLNDGRALPAFIGQALRGEDLTVFGDGSQTRSFCYVEDLVEGIYRLLLSDYAMPVNIGNPSEISLKDFAEEVLKLTGKQSKNSVQAIAGRRSKATQTRYYQSQENIELGTESTKRGRPCKNICLL
jgi:nucleoside-diphosphate-sugar epimerase